MKYEMTIIVDEKTAKHYDAVLASNDMMGEDDTFVKTAKFENGFEMDIKICGAENDNPWTEAVLFNENGAELVCTDVAEDFFGEWELEYNGDTYFVNVTRETEESGKKSYPRIEQCADKDILLSFLTEKQLDLIEATLDAYYTKKIDFTEPCYEDGTPDFSGDYELKTNDPSYTPNGFEILILKWVEDREDTGYLIDTLHFSCVA